MLSSLGAAVAESVIVGVVVVPAVDICGRIMDAVMMMMMLCIVVVVFHHYFMPASALYFVNKWYSSCILLVQAYLPDVVFLFECRQHGN